MMMAASLQLNIGWIILASFCAALGTGIYKFLPRIIKWQLEEVIEKTLQPDLQAVNDRINSHMDNEESSFSGIEENIQKINDHLASREKLFSDIQEIMDKTNGILEKHIQDDKILFDSANVALISGQRELIDRLEAIEASTQKKKKK